MKSKLSWREKVNRIGNFRIVDIPPRMQKRFGKGRMLIPCPSDIERLLKNIESGRLVTKSELRRKLAEEVGADVTCPLTAGIFLRLISEAAEEDLTQGADSITPYWRVVGDKGELIEKLHGGTEGQARKLAEENISTEKKKAGGKLYVKDAGRLVVRL